MMNASHKEELSCSCDGTTSGMAEKPNRPLNSYNLFFRYHRDLILNGKIESSDIYNAPLTITAADIASIDTSKRYDNGKRRNHRRTHGKIGFTDLSKIISHRWKTCDSYTRTLFEIRAAQEKYIYDEHMNFYLEQCDSRTPSDGTRKRLTKKLKKEMHCTLSQTGSKDSTEMHSNDLYSNPCIVTSSLPKTKHGRVDPIPCTVDILPRISLSENHFCFSSPTCKSSINSISLQDCLGLECDEGEYSNKQENSSFSSVSLEDLIDFNKKYVLKRIQPKFSSSGFDESEIVGTLTEAREEIVDDLSLIENVVSNSDQDLIGIANIIPSRSGAWTPYDAADTRPIISNFKRILTHSNDDDVDDRLVHFGEESAYLYPNLVRNGRVINEADLVRFNLQSIRRDRYPQHWQRSSVSSISSSSSRRTK